jgi:hypothetical protein
LNTFGEELTPKNLLTPNKHGRTPLHLAAMHGHLDQVMEIFRNSGETPTAQQFLMKDKSGNTPLRLATAQSHLEQVFSPSLWAGQVGEMIGLWKEVPLPDRAQLNFEALRDEAISQSVHAAKRQAIDGTGMSRSLPADGKDRETSLSKVR